MSRLQDIVRLYELLAELDHRSGGKKVLGQCHGRLPWPERGVYFFFEPGEQRSDSGEGMRVVQVGTHGVSHKINSRLWPRLRQHRGTVGAGGNHRSSRFRQLVGLSLKERGAPDPLSSWSLEQDHKAAALRLGTTSPAIKAAEANLEAKVTAHLGTLSFLCLPVANKADGSSDRSLIERNAIALLSNFSKDPIDPLSPTWLGRDCPHGHIRQAELWNHDYVTAEYTPSFLEDFAHYMRSA